MKKYCFLLDTSSPEELFQRKNTFYLPFGMIIENSKNKEEIMLNDYDEISRDQIIENINDGCFFKTSQTPIGIIEEKISELLKTYDLVICMNISKNLSGTYNSLLSLKKKFKDNLLIIDTCAVGVQHIWLMDKIIELLNLNYTHSQIEKEMKDYIKRIYGGIIVTNANLLTKGGRLVGLKALLVKALNIKLIIEWKNGKLEFIDKDISLNKAADKLWDKISKELDLKNKKIERICFLNEIPGEDGKKIIEHIKSKINDPKIKYENSLWQSCILIHTNVNTFSILVVVSK